MRLLWALDSSYRALPRPDELMLSSGPAAHAGGHMNLPVTTLSCLPTYLGCVCGYRLVIRDRDSTWDVFVYSFEARTGYGSGTPTRAQSRGGEKGVADQVSTSRAPVLDALSLALSPSRCERRGGAVLASHPLLLSSDELADRPGPAPFRPRNGSAMPLPRAKHSAPLGKSSSRESPWWGSREGV